MKLGEKVTFHSCGRDWELSPFTLGIWFAFCDWCRANIVDDPLARVSRLPIEKMSKEEADTLVKEAIAEDKRINDYRPESEATINRLGTPQGLMQAVYLLAGGPQGKVTAEQCDEMVSSFVFNGQMDSLMGYLSKCMGTPAKSAEKNGEAGASLATGRN